jgi:hypothetical protein
MRSAGHTALMGETTNAHKIVAGKQAEKDYLKNLCVNDRI